MRSAMMFADRVLHAAQAAVNARKRVGVVDARLARRAVPLADDPAIDSVDRELVRLPLVLEIFFVE
jgi:hypothetical protein